MFTITEAKGGFFDRDKILTLVDAGTRRALSKIGAFVRQRARTSIRYAKGSSSPGRPPHAHRGFGGKSPLRDLLFFAYDEATSSVVIGPAEFRSSRKKGSYRVPSVLETGGTVQVKYRGQMRTWRYERRPFMTPAMLAEMPNFPDAFQGLLSLE